tara:strand:+ start:1030 stop:1797 length:768 start_codon:yes stop_codon:yes gene_type:complete
MSEFKNKIVIVTGAASGIGFAVLKILSNKGAKVYGIDKSNISDLQKQNLSGKFIKADVSNLKNWEKVVNIVGDRVDILINSAGINKAQESELEFQNPDEVEYIDWKRINDVNVGSAVLGCKKVVPLMKKHGGAIVNISSIAATKGWPMKSAYGASKASILQYTKSLALYFANNGWKIRCNAVLPGPINTPMLSNNDQFTGGDGKSGLDHIPMRRLGAPEEVAKPILFLASDRSSYITGTGLCVDGGITAKIPFIH